MLRRACRVCAELKIDDPELWLATTERRVKALWMAFDDLEGLSKQMPTMPMGMAPQRKSEKTTGMLSPDEAHSHLASHMAARFG